MTWVLCYPGGTGLPARGHREVARAHHLGCSCTCCSLSGNIVRAGDSGIQPEGPPEATQTLKICFAKRKKRLLTMAASSPHGAASNTIQDPGGALRPSSVCSATKRGEEGRGRHLPCEASAHGSHGWPGAWAQGGEQRAEPAWNSETRVGASRATPLRARHHSPLRTQKSRTGGLRLSPRDTSSRRPDYITPRSRSRWHRSACS